MANSSKQKTWKNSSTSSMEEGLSPDDKKIRCKTTFTSSEKSCEPDEILSLSNMAETIMPKLELVLDKLVKVEAKLEELENYVKSMDAKVY